MDNTRLKTVKKLRAKAHLVKIHRVCVCVYIVSALEVCDQTVAQFINKYPSTNCLLYTLPVYHTNYFNTNKQTRILRLSITLGAQMEKSNLDKGICSNKHLSFWVLFTQIKSDFSFGDSHTHFTSHWLATRENQTSIYRAN